MCRPHCAMGKKKDLTKEEKELVPRFLFERFERGELQKGSIAAASAQFHLHRNTVSGIWNNRDDLECKKKGRVGAKRKYVLAEVKAAMEEVPRRQRQTIHATAASIGMPKSSFSDLIKTEDEIRRVTTCIKPRLRPANMHQRLDFVLKFVHPGMNIDIVI